jgi:hypothetical protein
VSDTANAPLFPPEEICAQAQSNAAAWILTIIAYLKERGGKVEETSPKIAGRIAGATLAGNLATRVARLPRCKRTAPAGGGRDVWARVGRNRPSLWP